MHTNPEDGLFKKIMQKTDTDKISSHFAKFFVWVVVITLPAKYWYRIAYYVSHFFGLISRQALLGKLSVQYQRAYRLNRLLSLFTRSGKAFDIPIKITGLELLHSTQNGLAICSVHLPLIKVGIRAILDSGFEIDAMIAGMTGSDGKMAFWGTTKRVKTIASAEANVLIKARSVLKENGSISLMIDTNLGNPLSPNMLRFCGKVGAKVVFLLAELADDHSVVVHLVSPPYPYCEDDNQVNENLNALAELRDDILIRYQLPPVGKGNWKDI